MGLKYVVRCAIWHHLHNLKNVKDTHGEVLILLESQASSIGVHIKKIELLFWRALGERLVLYFDS